jgi:hypothetical protein
MAKGAAGKAATKGAGSTATKGGSKTKATNKPKNPNPKTSKKPTSEREIASGKQSDVQHAVDAVLKTQGKEGGFGSRRVIKQIVHADQDYRTKRTMYRSAAAAASATAYANNMNGGIQYLNAEPEEKENGEDSGSGKGQESQGKYSGNNGSGQRF